MRKSQRPYPSPPTTLQAVRAIVISSLARSSERSAGQFGFAPRSSSLPVSHFDRYETMCHMPRGIWAKSISAIGIVSSPTIPTLTSRPGMKRCTSTSSQPSNIASILAERARMLRTTERCSMPTEASSATGLQMAGNPTLVISSPRRTWLQRGTGSPARSSTPLTTFFLRVSPVVQLELPVKGIPRSSRAEMTIGSYTASPSMPSTRLKIKSNFPFRTRSTQRPSLLTGTRTTSVAQSSSALSTASIESSSWTSGVFPRAERPSNNKAIFIACSSAWYRSRRSAGGERWRVVSSAGTRERAMEVDSLTRGSVFRAILSELTIADPRRSRGLRQTHIIRRIGKNSRQRIRFQHVRLSVGIEADIDSCPVSATKHAERVERYALNRRLKLSRDTRRTLENVERILRTIPDELRVEAVNRKRALGQRLEIHRDQGQHRRFGAIAEDRAGELLARQKFLDENRLPIVLQQELGLPEKLVAVPAKVAVSDSLRGAFVDRLHEKRQRQLLVKTVHEGSSKGITDSNL